MSEVPKSKFEEKTVSAGPEISNQRADNDAMERLKEGEIRCRG